MKCFKKYINENIAYGKMQPQHEFLIKPENKFLQHFERIGVMDKIKSLTPPCEEGTMRELNYLKDRTDNASQEQIQFANTAEISENELYDKFIRENLGINIPTNFVNSIIDQIDPVIFYFKKYFNRSRPEQFAKKINMPFQYGISAEIKHPAYPSGHALDSYIMEHVMTQLRPDMISQISDFCKNMRESRLDVGLHYPSDNVISKIIAKEIINSGLLEIPGA